MPLLRSIVNVESRFGEITADVNRVAQQAVAAGAAEGGRVAAEIAAQRSKTGRMAAIRVEPARGSQDGWEAAFVSPAAHSWFQNYGTLGNRRKALKSPPRTNRTRDPGTGVEPLFFLDAGRRAGRRAMLETLARGL